MQTYQFRCVDCGVLFEGTVTQQDAPVYCEFCDSQNVKKLFMVAANPDRDDEILLEDEC